MFGFKSEEKKKERKPSKPRNNQETSSELETESESSDSQWFGDASNSVVDFPEHIDDTSKLLPENESLRCKIEYLEFENEKLKEENIKFTVVTLSFTNFCYFSVGAIPICPSIEAIDSTMPQSFKNTYPSTHCIIDCTELFCQRPSSISTQSCMYSHCKSHVTYKRLLRIAPSGGITFISQLYDGSISDKEIVPRSGILDERFWQPNDSVMADRGFTIDEELKPLKVNLNIPAFLDDRIQLTKAEVKESKTIALVQIHVERAISRIKKIRIIRNEIPLTFHGSINQIWTVCQICLLCNFMPPLIQNS